MFGASPMSPNWHVGIHKNFLRETKDVVLVDRSFVDMFSFSVINGTVLSSPDQIVITHAFAQTLSNDIGSLVGKVLWIQPPPRLSLSFNKKNIAVPIEIGGIIETPPHNSSLTFAILLPFNMSSTFLGKKEGGWKWGFHSAHYIRLADNANMEEVKRKITQIIQKQSPFNSLWDLDTFKGQASTHHRLAPL